MDPNEADQPHVVVLVTRTGGFAGRRRAWRAEPGDDAAELFIGLIDQCPWDELADGSHSDGDSDDRGPRSSAHRGADRFVWSIEARRGEQDQRRAELAEPDVTGAWRALVDAVQQWGATPR